MSEWWKVPEEFADTPFGRELQRQIDLDIQAWQAYRERLIRGAYDGLNLIPVLDEAIKDPGHETSPRNRVSFLD